jgi:nitrogen fixation-related uncharacterized protein
MFPSSLAVIVSGLLTVLAGLTSFVWAWRHGQFADTSTQRLVIFEPRDLRIERPWESPAQRAERVAEHGRPVAARAGEWGGA